VAAAALGGASQTLAAATVATADAEFGATTAIHPNAAPVITPGLVLPARRIAQLPLELHSAPGIDAAILLTIMGRLAGDMARTSFGILSRQSRSMPPPIRRRAKAVAKVIDLGFIRLGNPSG
jgi:hypothetical protein